MRRRAIFDNTVLPYLLLAPQIAVTVVFFFWPAGQAIYQSLFLQDAFGLRQRFVWFDNFRVLLTDPLYLDSAVRTHRVHQRGDGPVDERRPCSSPSWPTGASGLPPRTRHF